MAKLCRGFTLVELLVAAGIMGVVGTMATIILFTSLQGASKADVMREVKQNGDFALTVMERMIRNAIAISLPSTCTTGGSTQGSLYVTNLDGGTTNFSLSGDKIASNAGRFLTNDKVKVSNLTFVCTRTAGQPDLVKINFTISQAGVTVRPEEKSSITFQTMVSLRTY